MTTTSTKLSLLLALFSTCALAWQSSLQQDTKQTPQRLIPGMLRAAKYESTIELLKPMVDSAPDNVNLQFILADAYFMNGQMKEAVAGYDWVIELRPDIAPQCWQRGLALYYAGQFEKGKSQFETHQTVNRQDVENSVWHMLCHVKIADLNTARKSMIPISGDQRIPMPQVFQMFAGTGSVQNVVAAAEEADSDVARYYAHLYIGLFQEMTGDHAKSIESMQKASKVNPLPRDRLMSSVADVHLKLRKLRDPDNRN